MLLRMKELLVIIDGMDDEPISTLGNLTPSHFAYMPALQYMRANGTLTWQSTIPPNQNSGTDVAVLSILGYALPADFSSRSWLEAFGCGIDVTGSDLCLRCNLISHKNGLIASHCAEGMTTAQSYEIAEILNSNFGGNGLEFYSNGTFRNLLIIRESKGHVWAEAPHTLIGKPLSHLLVRSDDSSLEERLNRAIAGSIALLKSYPANGISLWAPGRAANLESLNKRGAVVTGVNVMRGIAKVAGLSLLEVPGATGDEHTDYRAKRQAAVEALEHYDFVLLHIEAPDEVSHSRDPLKKVRVLEEIDRELLAPLLETEINMEITVQSDHGTSSVTGKHLDSPVEVVKYRINNKR